MDRGLGRKSEITCIFKQLAWKFLKGSLLKQNISSVVKKISGVTLSCRPFLETNCGTAGN